MDKNSINLFLAKNSGCFEEMHLPKIASGLEMIPDEKASLVLGADFKKPIHMLLVSIAGGTLGIDRFNLEQTGLGVLKLLSCGGFGIWAIVDFFLIQSETREYNAKKIIELINSLSTKTQRPSTENRVNTGAMESQPEVVNAPRIDTPHVENVDLGENSNKLPELDVPSSHLPGQENPSDYAPKDDYSRFAPKSDSQY